MGKVLDEDGLPELLTRLKSYIDTHGGGGGASSLAQLSDVEITDVQDGDVITYDSTEEKYVNAPASGGRSSFAGLDDVSISSPSDKQGIEYDATLQKYKNGSAKTPISSVAQREADATSSSHAYAVGEYLYVDDALYKVTTAIAIGDPISSVSPDDNVEATTWSDEIVEIMSTVGTVNSAFNSLFAS